MIHFPTSDYEYEQSIYAPTIYTDELAWLFPPCAKLCRM